MTGRSPPTVGARPDTPGPPLGPRAGRDGHLPRLPALDGLRGAAVVAVLAFHSGISWARGGFLGVDTFFVLSGYLITALLLGEWSRDGRIRLRAFWARRARRLLPALLLVLLGVAVYGAALTAPDGAASLRLDALSTLTYVANWRFAASGGGYFNHAALPSPLRHTWSLAVEEQFYLVWPLVCLAVLRCGRGRRRLLGVAATAAIASAALMALGFRSGHDPSPLYYRTDTRAQAVLVGAALAAVLPSVAAGQGDRHRRRRRLATSVGAVAAAGTLWAWSAADGQEAALYRGGFTALAVATAAVIAAVVLAPDGTLARMLSWRPLGDVGRVSYGLYLWHWPVFLALSAQRTALTGPSLLVVRLAVTAGLAVASYHLVELPVRRGALPAWRAPVALAGAAGVTVVSLLVATAGVRPASPSLASAPIASTSIVPGAGPSLANASEAALPAAPAPGPVEPVTAEPAVPVASAPSPTPAPAAPPVLPTGRRHLRVLLLGDSVALTLGYGFPDSARRYGVDVTDAALLGCGLAQGGPYRYFGEVQPALDRCADWETRWSDLVDRYQPDVVALLVGRWEVMDRVHDGRWMHVGQPVFDAYLTDELERAVSVLSRRGATVALLTAPAYHRGERPDGRLWPEDDVARVRRWNELLAEVAARHPGDAGVVDFGGRLSPEGRAVGVIDGVRVRSSDGVHVTAEGGRWLAPWLARELASLRTPSG